MTHHHHDHQDHHVSPQDLNSIMQIFAGKINISQIKTNTVAGFVTDLTSQGKMATLSTFVQSMKASFIAPTGMPPTDLQQFLHRLREWYDNPRRREKPSAHKLESAIRQLQTFQAANAVPIATYLTGAQAYLSSVLSLYVANNMAIQNLINVLVPLGVQFSTFIRDLIRFKHHYSGRDRSRSRSSSRGRRSFSSHSFDGRRFEEGERFDGERIEEFKERGPGFREEIVDEIIERRGDGPFRERVQEIVEDVNVPRREVLRHLYIQPGANGKFITFLDNAYRKVGSLALNNPTQNDNGNQMAFKDRNEDNILSLPSHSKVFPIQHHTAMGLKLPNSAQVIFKGNRNSLDIYKKYGAHIGGERQRLAKFSFH